MQTMLNHTDLPETQELREKLAEIIARVCNCDTQPLLEDKEFSTVIERFDSLAVLEILLEIEPIYGIETDEMLPVDLQKGAQDITGVFPTNLSELAAYLHEVVARRPEREAALQARMLSVKGLPNGKDCAAPAVTCDTSSDQSNPPRTTSSQNKNHS